MRSQVSQSVRGANVLRMIPDNVVPRNAFMWAEGVRKESAILPEAH